VAGLSEIRLAILEVSSIIKLEQGDRS